MAMRFIPHNILRASPHLSCALYINIIYFVKYGYAINHTYFIFHLDGTRQGDPISRLRDGIQQTEPFNIKSGDGTSNDPTRDGGEFVRSGTAKIKYSLKRLKRPKIKIVTKL